ncbi:glycosyltransferase family 39 protein [Actinoplanes sp. NPDC051494]|uniref:glycosyltransferase family 39 protein n=1 Tax=Actinoplanes sp. NPDC051494 TaxID=3363907 RepID=UPI0037A65BC2
MTATTLPRAEPEAPVKPPTARRAGSLIHPWLVPALVMLAVATTGLTRPALGWDEHATWSAARRSPGQLIDFAGNMDGVISPYYLFMHYWTAVFGDSLVAMRLPSLIAVVLGAGLVGELGRRLFSPGAGLVGGLIVTSVPQLSRYAQDARAYGIAFFFAVLATLLLYVALQRPTWWRWAAYGVALTLVGYSHMIGLLVLSGHVVAVATRYLRDGRDRRLLVRWPVMVVAALVLVSPLIRLGLTQRGTQLEWIGPMDLHQVLIAPGVIFGAPMAGLLIVGLAFAARWPERPRVLGELAALAAVPPILLIAVSFVTSPLWVPRYVLFVIVPLALLAAVALRGLVVRTVLVLALVVAVGFEAHQQVRDTAAHGGMDLRLAAAVVEQRQLPGDGIVYGRIGTWSLRSGFDYEMRGGPKPKDVLLRKSAAAAGGLDGVECRTLSCFDTQRIWYVGARRNSDALADQGITIRAKLKAQYVQTGIWIFPLGMVGLYERRKG